ncbi:MAG TPA: thiamine phosphate synthase [Terriglobales bacterium]|nr:thiamine phosphate synthase [Terriglobales bacterium]
MILYYITDSRQLGSHELLLEKIAEAAAAGVDYIQLRERDLPTRQLEMLSAEAVAAVRRSGSQTKLLINSRVDVALAVGADGVHLRSNDMAASEARAIWAESSGRTDCVIGVSCHSLHDVLSAEGHGADFVVFGPVFGKLGSTEPPLGLAALTQVVNRGNPPDPKVEAGQSLRMPVIALGGVTLASAADCARVGAAGVAAIRMFQERKISEIVGRLK